MDNDKDTDTIDHQTDERETTLHVRWSGAEAFGANFCVRLGDSSNNNQFSVLKSSSGLRRSKLDNAGADEVGLLTFTKKKKRSLLG